jgi:hypothetical protein
MVYEWKGDTGNGLVHVVFSVAMDVNDTAILDAATLSVGRTECVSKLKMAISFITVEITVHCRNLVMKIA